MRSLLLTLSFLAACNDKADDTGQNDGGTTATTEVDADGDGYYATEDCDDLNPDVNPGAAEACDGIDNDCDDSIDEEVTTTFYADADEDGYGDLSQPSDACSALPGTVPNADDCDDAEPDAWPGNAELCDGIDNDCNDLVDDDPSDASIWYADQDGDGFGDPDLVDEACEAPENYVDDDTDCDDTDELTFPGGDEVCDGADNDCNGEIDDGATDLLVWYADADEDGYGDAFDSIETCTPPEGYTLDSSDCDDTEYTTNPGADEYCDEVDNDCDGDLDESDSVDAPIWYSDGDGDSYGDPTRSAYSCSQPSGAVANDDDCDDSDSDTNPDGIEYCDTIDNNCDGTVDEDTAEDALTWYYDYDGDGYGDPLVTTEACSQPKGYVSNDDDCDDIDKSVSPSGTESCNGQDDDCDGDTDEDSSVDVQSWYDDADVDGYGDASTEVVQCYAPTGYVSDGTDCDDDEYLSNPGETEVCDTIDNDCDTVVDEDDSTDVLTWYADTDKDGYGDPSATDIDCYQPTGYVADYTDCDDDHANANPAGTEICDTLDNNCDGTVDEDSATDAKTWYADTDKDSYGNALSTDVACYQPTGFVSDNTDCDDSVNTTYPGAPEYCDTVDNDCDTDVDEDSAVDALTWYRDVDKDGYGNPTKTDVACYQPTGYVSDSTDCNDLRSDANPAATEYCDSIDNNCDGAVDEDTAADAPTWYADTDSDSYGDASSTDVACSQPSGYVSDDTDCNDSSNLAYPGGTEVCDSLDNNCDGTVDEDTATDAPTWYDDTDSDGYGDAGSPNVACSMPTGTVSNDEDCDDGDLTIYPGANEFCDTVDNDCDGSIDEADAVDAGTWYEDYDTDGYGDAASTDIACNQPSGFVSDATDCDDAEILINPAATEVCDGADNNCDGTVDEDTASDASTWYADTDTDGYGDPASTDTACSQPSGYVANSGDCDPADININPAASEICDSVDNDCDGLVDDDDPGLTGSLSTFYADTDLDGYGDATSTADACAEPSGYVTDDTDCDDGDITSYPGATDIPQDGIDQDCDGSDAPYAVTDLAVGDLIITEIMQNPALVVDTLGEYFEIYNNTGGEVDLDGMYVYDLGSDHFTVSGELLVSADSYAVFCIDSTTASNGGLTCDYDYSGFTLGNSDDEVYLAESSSKATVFDNVDYDGGPNFPDPIGYSMNLDPNYLDATSNDDGANWCEASSTYGDGDYGTPGSANDECAVATSTYGDGYSASGEIGTHGVGYLLGEQVTLSSAITLTAFGIRLDASDPGTGSVQFALYSDSGGTPSSLVAEAAGASVVPGDNEISVDGGSVSLAAGTYWLMKASDQNIFLVEEASSSATVYYKVFTYGGSLSSTWSGGSSYTDGIFATWLVGY